MLKRAWPVPVCAVVVAAIVYAAWPLVPQRFQSSTTILIVPPRVPAGVVRSPQPTRMDVLPNIAQMVFSRTLLEAIAKDFNLYPSERASLPIEDVVELVRKDAAIEVFVGDAKELESGGFTVSFVSPDPKSSMKVVDRLAAAVVDAVLQGRETLAEATRELLASQVEPLRPKLIANAKAVAAAQAARNAAEAQVLAIEGEALKAHYLFLLSKIADINLNRELEWRQIGEQFSTVDRARMPERPLGPTRAGATAVGGVIGAVVGLLLAAWLASKPAQST